MLLLSLSDSQHVVNLLAYNSSNTLSTLCPLQHMRCGQTSNNRCTIHSSFHYSPSFIHHFIIHLHYFWNLPTQSRLLRNWLVSKWYYAYPTHKNIYHIVSAMFDKLCKNVFIFPYFPFSLISKHVIAVLDWIRLFTHLQHEPHAVSQTVHSEECLVY